MKPRAFTSRRSLEVGVRSRLGWRKGSYLSPRCAFALALDLAALHPGAHARPKAPTPRAPHSSCRAVVPRASRTSGAPRARQSRYSARSRGRDQHGGGDRRAVRERLLRRELDSLARVVPLADLFRPTSPSPPARSASSSPWSSGNRATGASRSSVRRSSRARRARFSTRGMLRGNLSPGAIRLAPIPFRAVATGLAHRDSRHRLRRPGAGGPRERRGAPALRAGARDGRLFLVDGGLSANIPVAAARAAGAERVIVSDATEHPSYSARCHVADRHRRSARAVSFRQPDSSAG